MQGVNRVAKGMSSMHVNHEADEINGEAEYNSDYDIEDTMTTSPRQARASTKSPIP